MKWLEKVMELFNKRYEEEDLELEWESAAVEEWDWETLTQDRHRLRIQDEEERQKYIKSCVEQVQDASAELETLASEYNMVTAYLKDIEEIEALPQGEAQCVQENARKIEVFEKADKEYREKKERLTDAQFHNMETLENVMPKPYQDIKEAEDYRELIKGDLSKLEGEKQAYRFRRAELHREIENLKGMVVMCAMAFMVCIFMLLILRLGFEMDTQLGFILTIAAAAIVLTVLYVRYLDDVKQLESTKKGINKIVLLKNTVNIRYVNNTNLLDYLYMKYRVNSGKELLKMWEKYQQEKEERNREAENIEELSYYKKTLISILRRYQLHDPEIWIHQAAALVDKKEMVEIRHGLNDRRQKLRTQIEYNKRLMSEAESEIRETMEEYPQYREEITALVKELNKKEK